MAGMLETYNVLEGNDLRASPEHGLRDMLHGDAAFHARMQYSLTRILGSKQSI
jgi:hypothetical protein